jgi:DNA (cytosine-5)-methyltransferase 1
MELDNVLSDMESIGYATTPFVIPACAVDAKHRRDRLWIIGRRVIEFLPDADEQGSQGRDSAELRECASERAAWAGDSPMADTDSHNGFGRERTLQMGRIGSESTTGNEDSSRGVEWLPEPDVGRVAHGVPSRVDRLKGLGNAIVPQCAFEILRVIYQLIMETRCVTVGCESKDENTVDMARRKESSQKPLADGAKDWEEA